MLPTATSADVLGGTGAVLRKAEILAWAYNQCLQCHSCKSQKAAKRPFDFKNRGCYGQTVLLFLVTAEYKAGSAVVVNEGQTCHVNAVEPAADVGVNVSVAPLAVPPIVPDKVATMTPLATGVIEATSFVGVKSATAGMLFVPELQPVGVPFSCAQRPTAVLTLSTLLRAFPILAFLV